MAIKLDGERERERERVVSVVEVIFLLLCVFVNRITQKFVGEFC